MVVCRRHSYASGVPLFSLRGSVKATGFIILLTLSSISLAQNQTYSKAEQSRFHELNLAWGKAYRDASRPYFNAVIDSIDQFLAKYPQSIFRSGLLSYKFDLTAAVSTDTVLINQLADTLLSYDSLATTKLWLGEILITRNLSAARGARLIDEALPGLAYANHLSKANVLLGQYHQRLGFLTVAKRDLERAIRADSSRYEAWFAYLALARMDEDASMTSAIQRQIQELEQRDLLHFSEESTKSPNLFKSVSPFTLKDMNGTPVPLSSFRNKVFVVNFFGFWCGGCIAELPILQQLGREFPSVLFLYVTSEDPTETKNVYLSKPQFQFLRTQRLLFNEDKISIAIGFNGVPRTLIVDKHGVIRFDYLGYTNGSKELFEANIRMLLHEH